MKFIHLTDPHLVAPGLKLYGLDPEARLRAAIADINKHHADAGLCVVTGDLTHWGEPEAYALFRNCMDRLAVPYVAMVGNHDRRAAALEALPAAPQDENGFVQGYRDTTVGRMIFLDTLNEATHAGELCDKRLAWLADALESLGKDQPILLFMHHPPFEMGLKTMDRIALVEIEPFWSVIRGHVPRIRHLFFGHVHRPVSGAWRGIPFSTLRGTNHQVVLDLTDHNRHLASHEPPAYAVVLAEADQLVVHLHDYLDASPRFLFAHPEIDARHYQQGPLMPV